MGIRVQIFDPEDVDELKMVYALSMHYISAFTKTVLSLVVVGTLVACDNDPAAMSEDEHDWQNARHQIEGSVLLRERIALPDSAEIEVQLLDITRINNPVVIASTGPIKPTDSPPYRYSLDVFPANIVKGKTYGLKATLMLDGKLVFTSRGYIDVSGGKPKLIVLERVLEK